MRLILGFIVAVLLLNASSAMAEYDKKQLSGATTYTLFPGSQDKKRCPFSEDDIKRAFNYPISSSKLKESEYGDLYVNISIQTMEVLMGGEIVGCVAYIDFEAIASLITNIVYNNKRAFFKSELYSDKTMLISGKSGMNKMISESIEEFTKEFITQYNLDNK
jgi:hypothetical protein